MADMLVQLYKKREKPPTDLLAGKNIVFCRALAIDKQVICTFIEKHFHEICPGWVDECMFSLFRNPTTCFIAIQNKRVIGFACYDATAKGMVGPVGVDEEFRKLGIARILLDECFEAMKMEGYAYAVIGWVSSEKYYANACGAETIPDSFPGIYERMVSQN